MKISGKLLLPGMALTVVACDDKSVCDRPNILFCIADDATYAHFSAYGCDWVNTPGFDRVASEGVLFNNCYTPNAKSAPSRAVVLTGRYSWQLETGGNHITDFPARYKGLWKLWANPAIWSATQERDRLPATLESWKTVPLVSLQGNLT